MQKFLHISFNFEARSAKINELIPAFNNAIDWIRYAPNCWVVLTTSDPFVWYQRLQPLVHDSDTFFICEIDMMKARAGNLPQMVWDWITRHTGQETVPITPLLALPPPDS